MAQKFKLIPVSENSRSENEIDIEGLIGMLPKRYRNKAKIVLVILKGKVQFDDNHHILYQNGERGSHVVDLIKYYLTPEALKIKRPFDSLEFGRLLSKFGVPQSALARPINAQTTFKYF